MDLRSQVPKQSLPGPVDQRTDRPLAFPEAQKDPPRTMAGTAEKKTKPPITTQQWTKIVLTAGSLATIGAGAWFFHPGVALLLVGGLIWIDLQLWAMIDNLGAFDHRDRGNRRAAR